MHDGLPDRLAGAGLNLPPLELLPLAEGVAAAGFQSSGREALDWWRRLDAVAGRTGCRPVLIPSVEGAVLAGIDDGTPRSRLENADRLDAGAILNPRGAWARLDEHDQRDALERWPAEPHRLDAFGLPYLGDGRPAPVVLALVVAEHGWQIPTMVNFGGWNACPPATVHGAVLRRWSHRYGAELVCMASTGLELALAKPPRSRPDAMTFASEYAVYCLDGMSLYDADDVPDLAACLIDAELVRFWWD